MPRPQNLIAALATALIFPSLATAECITSGVITRIDGRPGDVVISRNDRAGPPTLVPRPRVLEMICQGDVIRVQGASSLLLSLDGTGPVRVTRAAPYTVVRRAGTSTILGNARREFNDQVMPDMKRMPWSTRLRGRGDDFGFALPALGLARQTLTAGRRQILVRLLGGTGPFRVTLSQSGGGLVSQAQSASRSVLLEQKTLPSGLYSLRITDMGAVDVLEAVASVQVVAGPAPLDPAFDAVTDPEVRSAMQATAMARHDLDHWAFEAEQVLNSAPALGLDRARVYELIEMYGSAEP